MASLLFDPTGVFLREITAFGERFTDSMALRSEEETIAGDFFVRLPGPVRRTDRLSLR